MSEELRKSKESRKRLGRYVILSAIVCSVLGMVACANKKQEEQEIATVTPVITLPEPVNGFESANKELVNEMAKKYAETVVVKVGEEEISMDKAMLLICSMERSGNYHSTHYETQYGTDYWEMVYDDTGRTTREVFKEQTMDTLIQYAVLYDCAVKNGMTLSAEELAENNADVERIKESLSAEETERGGFTTEVLLDVCAWMMLAEKYYDKMTEGFGITRESVSEKVNKDDYKEFETEYIYLATTYYDENYELQEETTEIKEAYAQQMEDFYTEVLEGVTFEELATSESALIHNTRTFLADGTGAEAAYVEVASGLKVGEISRPVQTEYGIYLVKMLDDECTKSYEAAVDAAYEVERSEAFAAAYEVLLSEYPVEVKEETWGEVIFGATVSIIE